MPDQQKTCFVVMGFGEKTDFQTQRLLDLDKTYRIIIKRAVEDAGLKCIRADDVMHAGIIDKPMYELLLGADVVIADLSTSNANAIYELGVRHALRPNTTIVIAESQFKFPFDLGHLLIRPYTHLGKGIDAEEGERVRAELTKAIKELIVNLQTDSPVYTFLNGLIPPALRAAVAAAAGPELRAAVAAAAAPLRGAMFDAVAAAPAAAPAAVQQAADEMTNTILLEAIATARAQDDFLTARGLLSKLLERRPNDPYVIQQLALCTYKGKLPTPLAALLEAHKILQALEPQTSTDPETLGLWGAIHKRLWDINRDPKDLDESVRAYERGFYLRNDHYTGINYAYMLNERAAISARADAIADFVSAERVRRRVIGLCEQQLEQGIKDDDGKRDKDAMFWLTATLIEAYVGVGDEAQASAYLEKSKAHNPQGWMLETLQSQLGRLRLLLQGQAALTKF